MVADHATRSRAIAVFSYLRDLAQLRTKPVRDVDDYPRVLWFADIPHEHGCHNIARSPSSDETDSEWLEVQRPRDNRPPSPPPLCLEWLPGVRLDDPSEPPVLPHEIIVRQSSGREMETEPPSPRTIEEVPDVAAAWQQYLQRQWMPWRDRALELQEVQDAYARLFAINQDLKRIGEEFELVVAFGYLTWRHPSGYQVRRHILAAQAALDFDAARGAFAVRAAAEGLRLSLELDCIEPQDRFDLETQRSIEAQLVSLGDTLWDKSGMGASLRRVVYTFADKGHYSDAIAPHQSIDPSPTISLAPALILRKRTAKTMIAAIEKIIHDLQHGGVVPGGTARLCTDEGVSVPGVTDGQHSAQGAGLSDGALFPLPANAAQLEIADKLELHDGVLVQGPPGTGKSHTIANLICHLLATGRRVLVTAQSPRALKVLKDKLPKEIVPLCVSVLGNDREALENLQHSVLEISSRWSNWDPRHARIEIERLQESRASATQDFSSLRRRLRDLRESETHRQSVADDAYKGTAQRIAERLRKEEAIHGWLKDSIPEDDRLPFAASEFRELRRAYQLIPPDREAELGLEIPDPADLPTENTLDALYLRERTANEQLSEFGHVLTSPFYRVMESAARDRVTELQNLLDQFLMAEHDVTARPMKWIPDAVRDVLADQDRPWAALVEATERLLNGLADRARSVASTEWSTPGDVDLVRLRADADDLRSHLSAGRGFGIPGFRPAVVKRTRYVTNSVTVDGRPCRSIETLDALLRVLSVELAIRRATAAWGDKLDPISGVPGQRVAVLEEQAEALNAVLALGAMAKYAAGCCAGIPGLVPPPWIHFEQVHLLRAACAAVLAKSELRDAAQAVKAHSRKLREGREHGQAHPIWRELATSIDSRDLDAFRRHVATVHALLGGRALLLARRRMEDRLESLAPTLLRELSDSPGDIAWEGRLAALQSAWNWSRARSWLRRLENDRRDGSLSRRLHDANEKVNELTGSLAAKQAWLHAFSRMTETERQHLIAWQQAIKRVGKGTGKYATKHRRDAQEHLEKCRGAIPAWIMPLHRVYETISPSPEIFDVAIVDEASQCGPDALVVMYLARKVVVVGDDQQISPEAVGLDRQSVHHLIAQHLSALPHPDSFTVDGSLFAHGEIRYGNRIVLREHFRCMPEIIRFSNDLCYLGSPLVPLRRYAAERLRPIVTVYVDGGTAEGTGSKIVNRLEAERVVAAIRTCAGDARYGGKTFGVISLQGDAQAQLIEAMLLEELDSKEIEERKIVCGDAYSFQGDERSVMFLSMVAAPNRRIGTLSKEADKRRFNVAASRAQDQAWLFHSASLNDLSELDLRHSLLKYYLHPTVVRAGLPELSLEDLTARADDARRELSKPPKPFDSWFEMDVYLALVGRGFRVVPQYPAAGYRIDLVIEGVATQLAVECDGDEWHGAEEFDADDRRQRVLERCGWRFCRLPGSEFYADPEKAIDRIASEAARLGIDRGALDKWDTAFIDGYVPEIRFDVAAVRSSDLEPEPAANRSARADAADGLPSVSGAGTESPILGRVGAAVERQQDPAELRLGKTPSPLLAGSEWKSERIGETLPVIPTGGDEESALVEWADGIDAQVWFGLSHWARLHGKLQPWQRRMIYDIGLRVAKGIPVSVKQARQGKKAYVAAIGAGFDPSDAEKAR